MRINWEEIVLRSNITSMDSNRDKQKKKKPKTQREESQHRWTDAPLAGMPEQSMFNSRQRTN